VGHPSHPHNLSVYLGGLEGLATRLRESPAAPRLRCDGWSEPPLNPDPSKTEESGSRKLNCVRLAAWKGPPPAEKCVVDQVLTSGHIASGLALPPRSYDAGQLC
jgi:hypothetical protein